MKIIFLDTNIFLQCKSLENIQWCNVIHYEEILLIIPRTVIREIDNLKYSDNNRKAKRARKVNSFLGKFDSSINKIIEIKSPDIKINITKAPFRTTKCELPDFLDLSIPDDKIISEIIAYKNSNSDDEVFLLSFDNTIIAVAEECKINVIKIPENWLLPTEPDKRDKKIKVLEAEIKNFKNSCPAIEFGTAYKKKDNNDIIQIDLPIYNPLNNSEIEKSLETVKSKYSIVLLLNKKKIQKNIEESRNIKAINPIHNILGSFKEFVPPSEADINKFKNEEYPKWLLQVKEYLLTLHTSMNSLNDRFNLQLKLKNTGNVPSENLIVNFNLEGNFQFCPYDFKNYSSDKPFTHNIPSSPKAPAGKWVEMNSIFPNYSSMFRKFDLINPTSSLLSIPPFSERKKRDRNLFYLKSNNTYDYTNEWIFECEEFQHKIKSKNFNSTILILQNDKSLNGALSCTVTAKNLPTPFKKTIPITINYIEKDLLAIVKSYLNEFVNGTKYDKE